MVILVSELLIQIKVHIAQTGSNTINMQFTNDTTGHTSSDGMTMYVPVIQIQDLLTLLKVVVVF